MDTTANKNAKTWGVSSAEFYADLRDKPTQIVAMDSKVYKGVLIGVDLYDLVLKQSSGAVFLIAKHSVKFVQADMPA